jgi:hypothetical protein
LQISSLVNRSFKFGTSSPSASPPHHGTCRCHVALSPLLAFWCLKRLIRFAFSCFVLHVLNLPSFTRCSCIVVKGVLVWVSSHTCTCSTCGPVECGTQWCAFALRERILSPPCYTRRRECLSLKTQTTIIRPRHRQPFRSQCRPPRSDTQHHKRRYGKGCRLLTQLRRKHASHGRWTMWSLQRPLQ